MDADASQDPPRPARDDGQGGGPEQPEADDEINPKLRTQDHGNPGRRAIGISHTELSAFCAAIATPQGADERHDHADHQGQPGLAQGSELCSSCGPITGYCASAESSRRLP